MGKLTDWKVFRVFVVFLIVVAVGIAWLLMFRSNNFSNPGVTQPPPENTEVKIEYAVIPQTTKRMFLAVGHEPNTSKIVVYTVDLASGKVIGQSSFSTTNETGITGLSSFNCVALLCKNAVWFSTDGTYAIVQTEFQPGPNEDPPFWYAWYLWDKKTGKLKELYKADIELVEWVFDARANKIYYQTDDPNAGRKMVFLKYFELDPDNKKLTELKKEQYPTNIFLNYYPLFSKSKNKMIQYKFRDKIVTTNIAVSGLHEVKGVGFGD